MRVHRTCILFAFALVIAGSGCYLSFGVRGGVGSRGDDPPPVPEELSPMSTSLHLSLGANWDVGYRHKTRLMAGGAWSAHGFLGRSGGGLFASMYGPMLRGERALGKGLYLAGAATGGAAEISYDHWQRGHLSGGGPTWGIDVLGGLGGGIFLHASGLSLQFVLGLAYTRIGETDLGSLSLGTLGSEIVIAWVPRQLRPHDVRREARAYGTLATARGKVPTWQLTLPGAGNRITALKIAAIDRRCQVARTSRLQLVAACGDVQFRVVQKGRVLDMACIEGTLDLCQSTVGTLLAAAPAVD